MQQIPCRAGLSYTVINNSRYSAESGPGRGGAAAGMAGFGRAPAGCAAKVGSRAQPPGRKRHIPLAIDRPSVKYENGRW